MLPVIQLGPLSLPTGPLALLLAVWAALAVGAWAARREGLNGDDIYNAGLNGLVAGLVAARLAHVIVYWDAYRTQLLEIFGFNQRAFLLWPGVIVALAVAGWYVYRHRLPLVKVLDAIAPGVLVGIAIVDVAALLTGRNAGLPAPQGVPWAVSLWGVPRHPVQLYEALTALAVAGLALWMIARGSRPGSAALVALCGYGLSRWLLEPFRAPEASVTILGGLRLAQVVGLALAVVALWGLGRLATRTG